MTLDRQRQVIAGNPAAVIGDPDERHSARRGRHLDTVGAGIERVLDQFLDHARRPLDHLAGGDAVDHVLAEAADRHWAWLLRTILSDSCRSGKPSADAPAEWRQVLVVRIVAHELATPRTGSLLPGIVAQPPFSM